MAKKDKKKKKKNNNEKLNESSSVNLENSIEMADIEENISRQQSKSDPKDG